MVFESMKNRIHRVQLKATFRPQVVQRRRSTAAHSRSMASPWTTEWASLADKPEAGIVASTIIRLNIRHHGTT
jgi:hypothetical protein